MDIQNTRQNKDSPTGLFSEILKHRKENNLQIKAVPEVVQRYIEYEWACFSDNTLFMRALTNRRFTVLVNVENELKKIKSAKEAYCELSKEHKRVIDLNLELVIENKTLRNQLSKESEEKHPANKGNIQKSGRDLTESSFITDIELLKEKLEALRTEVHKTQELNEAALRALDLKLTSMRGNRLQFTAIAYANAQTRVNAQLDQENASITAINTALIQERKALKAQLFLLHQHEYF
ncbi:hypothetical protein [Endozoicomonas elysicola]|uniref:Uncharacterized protein n=1 Tax=Endozoicomonas elysicola TaxID=305900 RepID=A0A081KC47_9GAMM|nr:hypothetical protein [Endozoicomonas elysicola]KEI71723.1 hypothetical protein GV64_14110 [Endozoicomonas elysicola]